MSGFSDGVQRYRPVLSDAADLYRQAVGQPLACRRNLGEVSCKWRYVYRAAD